MSLFQLYHLKRGNKYLKKDFLVLLIGLEVLNRQSGDPDQTDAVLLGAIEACGLLPAKQWVEPLLDRWERDYRDHTPGTNGSAHLVVGGVLTIERTSGYMYRSDQKPQAVPFRILVRIGKGR